MNKNFKKALTLGLACTMILTGCAGGQEGSETETAGKGSESVSVVIRFGSHAGNSMNPDYKDPVTGEYAMSEEYREITLAAMKKVEDELNVKIEWVQFPGETTEVLLQSVMAVDPVADVVNL